MQNRREYFCEGLPPEIKKRAKEELGETEEVKTRCLKELKALIKEEPDFHPNLSDGFLLRYLRARKFNVPKALKTLKNYYQYKARYSKIITDFTPSDLKTILEVGQTVAIDYRNHDDVGLGLIRIGQYNIDKFTSNEILALVLLCCELGLKPEVTQIVGYSIIIDFAGFNMRMIQRYASPTFIYRFITAIQDCLPARIKAYHIVNEPALMSVMYSVVKNFLSDKLKSRVHFHGSNMSRLHEHIVKDILPKELGGTYGPVSKIAEKYIPFVLSHEDHFKNLIQFGYKGETLQQLRSEV